MRPRRRRTYRDNLKDFRVKAHEFDGSLKLDDYLKWVQSMERIFDIEGYSGEKAFKLVFLKLKQFASLWYENLKKTEPWK